MPACGAFLSNANVFGITEMARRWEAAPNSKERRSNVHNDINLLRAPTDDFLYLGSNYLQNSQTTSGGVETFIRTLASHAQYIPDRLP